MNHKILSDEKGLKFFEGSEKITVEAFATIYVHKELKRIIAYQTSNNKILHNLVFQSDFAYQEKLDEILAEFKASAKQEFFNKVPHNVRVGDVFVAHENSKAAEKDLVHFYQVMKVDQSNSITVMEIESQTIQFGNYFKSIPLIGRKKGAAITQYDATMIDEPNKVVVSEKSEFQADVIQATFKTPEGYLAFAAKFTILNIANCVDVKVYEPVTYGLVI